MNDKILGVDIGGTGIKGAIVDMKTGKLLTERKKFATPVPSTPEAVCETIGKLIEALDYDGELIGCGFPAIVKDGVALTAANVDDSWIGVNIEKVLSKSCNKTVKVLNDADAAGLAEIAYGAAKGEMGTVILITIGTGIGSAMFTNGHLVHNSELGHFHLGGHDKVAEKYVSNAIRKKENLKINLRVIGLSNSRKMIFDGSGLNLKDWKEDLSNGEIASLDGFFEKAKALLAEAGYPDGFTTKVAITELASLNGPMQALQAQLAKVGITLELEVMEHSSWHSAIRDDVSSLVLYGAARFPVADTYLTQFYHSDSIVQTPKAVTNFSHCDVADAEIVAARSEPDTAKQLELWATAQAKLVENVCSVPLFELLQVWGRSDAVDYGVDLQGSLSLGPVISEKSKLN